MGSHPRRRFAPGHFFYFDAITWPEIAEISSRSAWEGKRYHVSQKRSDGTLVWSVQIVVMHSPLTFGTFGHRLEVPDGGQWQIGDLIIVDFTDKASPMESASEIKDNA